MPQHIDGDILRPLNLAFMIQAHQIIVDLLKTPNLAHILQDLNDPAKRRAASAHPLKFARDAGVDLPETGVTIQFHEFPNNWEVEIQVVIGSSFIVIGFNSRKGFFNR